MHPRLPMTGLDPSALQSRREVSFLRLVSIVGPGPVARVRAAAPRPHSATLTQARASRAGALPPEAVETQRKAAGVQ